MTIIMSNFKLVAVFALFLNDAFVSQCQMIHVTSCPCKDREEIWNAISTSLKELELSLQKENDRVLEKDIEREFFLTSE